MSDTPHLDALPDVDRRPLEKPEPRIRDRVAYKQQRERDEADFRNQVWERDGYCCRACGRRVFRTNQAVPQRGEVHHLRPRSLAKGQRLNPKNAVLLCALDHADVTTHRLTIVGTDATKTLRFTR